MALRARRTRLERRQRERWRTALVRTLLYAGVLALVAYWAYSMGSERAELRNLSLVDRLASLQEENRRLHDDTEAAIRERAVAAERLAESQRRYRSDVPAEDEREILNVVRQRMADGVPRERFLHVLEAVQISPRCASDVLTRRFLLQTSLSVGTHASVSFANNAIVVTGTGMSAHDPAGNREAWFDAAEPVRIAFTAPGGAESVSEGLLPLHHAVVLGNKAHNFTMTAAQTQGFVSVTEQVCDYP